MYYDYKCSACEHVQEEMHGMNDKPDIRCEVCGEKCEKVFLSTTPVHFVGAGWDRSPHVLIDKLNGRKRTKYGSKEDK